MVKDNGDLEALSNIQEGNSFTRFAKTFGGVSDDSSAQWDVENNAIDGGILHVKVNSGGAGYTQGNYTSVAINGDGSSGVCTVHVNASGNVSHVTVTANGSGYKRATINAVSYTHLTLPTKRIV